MSRLDAGPSWAPLVSVVVPSHNRAPLLARAIDSVLAQTLADWELLLVDDASDDDTERVVAGFPDARIRFLRLAARGGPGRARNRGADAARGELIAFLDSDDEWLPTKLERQAGRLRERDGGASTVVYCPYVRRDGLTGRLSTPYRALHEGAGFAHLVGGWTLVTSAVLMRRATFLAAGGFDEILPASEDYDLWLRLAMTSAYFVPVPEALVIVHLHSGPQLTANPTAQTAAFHQLDARWRERIRAACGPASYRRWKARQHAYIHRTQFLRVRKLAAAGRRGAAWRECAAMVWLLRWSRRFLLQALVLLALGEAAYTWLARAEAALVARYHARP